jgi:long-chain fatty acid transport protein
MRVARTLTLIGCLWGLAAPAWGAGFQLQDFDAKALGMANAFAAMADNPSAVYFNPAGIMQLEGMQGSASAIAVIPHTQYQADPGHGRNIDMSQGPVVIPGMFGTAQLTEHIALGLGLFTPYALGVEYDKNWGGRYIATKARLAVIENNLNVAVSIPMSDTIELALAGGASIVSGELSLKRRLDLRAFGADDGNLDLVLRTGSRPVPRWNVAGQLLINDGAIRLGVSYRHDIEGVKTKGRLKVADAPDALGLNGRYRSRASTRFPAELRAGIAVEVTDALTLEVDYRWTHWNVMRELKVKNSGFSNLALELKYSDSSYVAVGADYRLNDLIALRGGVLWDQTPVRKDEHFSPLVPDNDRFGFTLGAGFQITESINVDLAYLGLYIFPRAKRNDEGGESVFGGQPIGNGEYRTWAHLVGLSIGIKL